LYPRTNTREEEEEEEEEEIGADSIPFQNLHDDE